MMSAWRLEYPALKRAVREPMVCGLSAGGRWIRTSGSWSDLLRRNALPGDLPVFLAFVGPARRRNEDHALALEAHPTHLIAADPGRIRRRVNPRDKPLAIIGVITAIGAVFPADAGRQLLSSVAYNGHHAPSAVKVTRPRALPP